jgi:hypothetical protein
VASEKSLRALAVTTAVIAVSGGVVFAGRSLLVREGASLQAVRTAEHHGYLAQGLESAWGAPTTRGTLPNVRPMPPRPPVDAETQPTASRPVLDPTARRDLTYLCRLVGITETSEMRAIAETITTPAEVSLLIEEARRIRAAVDEGNRDIKTISMTRVVELLRVGKVEIKSPNEPIDPEVFELGVAGDLASFNTANARGTREDLQVIRFRPNTGDEEIDAALSRRSTARAIARRDVKALFERFRD